MSQSHLGARSSMTFGPKRCMVTISISMTIPTITVRVLIFSFCFIRTQLRTHTNCLYNTAAKASNGYDLKLCSRTGRYNTSYTFWPETVFGTSQEDKRTKPTKYTVIQRRSLRTLASNIRTNPVPASNSTQQLTPTAGEHLLHSAPENNPRHKTAASCKHAHSHLLCHHEWQKQKGWSQETF